MSEAWLVFGICIVVVLGAAIPLLKGRDSGKEPPIPRQETLEDWRNRK